MNDGVRDMASSAGATWALRFHGSTLIRPPPPVYRLLFDDLSLGLKIPGPQRSTKDTERFHLWFLFLLAAKKVLRFLVRVHSYLFTVGNWPASGAMISAEQDKLLATK
jgi:hypothetical protein